MNPSLTRLGRVETAIVRGLSSIDEAWRAGADVFDCYVSPTAAFRDAKLVRREVFTTMVIHDLLAVVDDAQGLRKLMARALHRRMRADGLFLFFVDDSPLPPDADCTSTGLVILHRHGLVDRDLLDHTLDRLMANTAADGVVATYLEAEPDRQGLIDPIVAVNVLYLAAHLDRSRELAVSRGFVEHVLRQRLFTFGTRYYPYAASFLYFLARLVADHPDEYGGLRTELLAALDEDAQGRHADRPMATAQRLAARARLADFDDDVVDGLLGLQAPDRAWPIDAFFRYGRSGHVFGARPMTTAFAIHTLQQVRQRRLRGV